MSLWFIETRWRTARLALHRIRTIFLPRRRSGHVLVLHTGRSGSTVIGDLLDQHSSIVWGGEVFERMLDRAARRERRAINALRRRFSLNDFARAVRRRLTLLAGNRIYGLEVQGYHLEKMGTDAMQFLRRMELLGFDRYVLLSRCSPIRQVASQLVALERGKHHVERGVRLDRVRVKIEPERLYFGHRFQSLEEVLKGYDTFWQSVRGAITERAVLELNYERDIQDNPLDAYAKLCAFLQVDMERPRVRLAKTTAHPLEEVIENLEELRAYLALHGRAELLEDCAAPS